MEVKKDSEIWELSEWKEVIYINWVGEGSGKSECKWEYEEIRFGYVKLMCVCRYQSGYI